VPTAAVWRDSLLAVLFVSAIPLAVMAALATDERAVRRAGTQLVCFAVGALLGAAFFQLIPEAYETARVPRAVPATVLLGYATFFALEWLLHGAHGHHDPRRAPRAHRDVPGRDDAHARSPRRRTLVALNLVGDGLHNLLDGMLIAATFLTDPAVGVLTTAAVSLHEVPRELGSFGVLVHGGVSPRRAVLYNLWSAALALLGAVGVLAAGPHAAALARALLPFAAGNFLYIAASLLVPLLRRPGTPRLVAARAALVALGLAATGAPALFR
jgi:zinc and cadmium transporter